MAGCFITLEGIDGTGKTTQAHMLVDALRAEGHSVIHTREPGGTPLGSRLRELLLTRGDFDLSVMTEMLLMAADRAQHVDEVVRPGLAAGQIIVSERYVDSSIAYQSAAGVSLEDVRRVNAVATGGLLPDITFLFDADPTKTFRQTSSDRIEERSLAYHQEVRDAFRKIHESEPERVVLMSVAGKGQDEIHRAIMKHVRRQLTKRAI